MKNAMQLNPSLLSKLSIPFFDAFSRKLLFRQNRDTYIVMIQFVQLDRCLLHCLSSNQS